MKALNFPLLTKDQIEVRVGQVSAKGCTLLLYKTSRTDAEILDSVVGAGNWQKRFYTLQGVGVGDQVRAIVVCSVGIYDEDRNEWIWKDDSGTESQVEQDKGVCSDAFKRAAGGSCWGIGRELYYTGFIFAKVPTKEKPNGKGYDLADKYMSFEIRTIEWNTNPLSLKKLVIVDSDGNVVFSKGVGKDYDTQQEKPKEQPLPQANEPKGSVDPQDLKTIREIIALYTRDESRTKFFKYVEDTYNVKCLEELTLSQGKEIIKVLTTKR